MEKQYITIEQFDQLKLSDSVLFIIDANVRADYLMKHLDVKRCDLESWKEERKPLINKKSYKYDMIKKLNAIRLMQLVTDFINHNFWTFECNEDVWCIQLFHHKDCEAPSEEGHELIDVLFKLFEYTNKRLTLHFTGEI